MNAAMSAIGPKRTSVCALHMSAFGGKADIALTLPIFYMSGGTHNEFRNCSNASKDKV